MNCIAGQQRYPHAGSRSLKNPIHACHGLSAPRTRAAHCIFHTQRRKHVKSNGYYTSRTSGVVVALRNIDQPEALLFDCDGVLVDTERDGHRVTFNQAFASKGLDHEWGVDLYGKLLEIGGGKERMTKYFTDHQHQEPFKSIADPEQRKAFVAELHRIKTDMFMEFIESGVMPLRPGVKRLVEEALANDVRVAVCSTSNERAVSTIVRVLLGEDIAARMPVFAGDMVPKKKPAPDIYLLAAERLGVNPARCVVVEDSRIGLLAAKAAGMRCVVTTSSYTADEDFALADAVFDCIGEENEARFSVGDLTTPGTFWLNPPLPMAEDGSLYGAEPAPADEAAVAIDIDPPTRR